MTRLTARANSVLADTVIGPHSSLTNWVFEVVEKLVVASSNRSVLRLDRFDPISFLAHARPVCLINYPSAQIVDAIDRGDARVIFVVEPVDQVFHYLRSCLCLSEMDAIRTQTVSAVANLAIGRSSSVHFVSRTSTEPIKFIVAGLAAHLELEADADILADVANDVSHGLGSSVRLEEMLRARGDHYISSEDCARSFAEQPLRQACADIMTPLNAMARGDTTRPVVWPTSVFKIFDRPESLPPLEVDIAGPSRNLFYGPYLYLPPARYHVEAILDFSNDIKDVPFVLEVHGASWLARVRIEKGRSGRYRGYFKLDHHQPTSNVEIRLRNVSDVPYGRMSLIEMLFFVDRHVPGGDY